jgi:3',5'-cyclic AMP phosphodiesterase CpdA
MTDIHLNFLSSRQIDHFLATAAATLADAFVISGDIAEAPSVCDYLERMVLYLKKPLYFVLGNHDYYHGSIERVRRAVQRTIYDEPLLHYLNLCELIELSPTTALIGHDGWADGRYGDFMQSSVLLNDYFLIHELAYLNQADRWAQLQALGDEAAAHFRRVIPPALAQYEQVLVVLHPPPFLEAYWHEGQNPPPTSPYVPHFASRTIGDALRELALRYPQQTLTVLCGHTHGKGEAQILPNLRVLTGGAVYSKPTIQTVFEF